MGHAIALVLLLAGVIAGVIAITQAQRKVPVQYAQRAVGRKVYSGGTSFMPLRVNYSGVMPIIFAQAILMFPQKIFQFLGQSFNIKFFGEIAYALAEGAILYMVLYGLMILFFSYFWVATQFNELQIADDLKKNGGYIPGVRPGQATSDYLHNAMSRITLAGAIFLTVIALIPIWLYRVVEHSLFRGYLLWRHEHADPGRRLAGYDAPDGNASADAPLRRLPEEGAAPGPVLMIILKSERDLEAMRPACAVAASVLDEVAAFIQPGVTTKEVDEFAASRMKHYGARSAFLGYRKYPCQICISVNDQVVHGLAGARQLRFGDIVSLDVGVIYNGFIGDTARTVAVGGCSVLAQKLMDVTEKALYEGIAQALPGGRVADISRAIQSLCGRQRLQRRAGICRPRGGPVDARRTAGAEFRGRQVLAQAAAGDDLGH